MPRAIPRAPASPVPASRARRSLGPASLVAALVLAACAGRDAAESALLLVDRDARGRGITVEVEGEPLERAELPVAVDVHAETVLVRDGEREPIVLAPDELVEITADGEIRRGPVDPDRLTIAASAEDARTFAEMLGGADVEPIDGATFALRSPGITWLAAALHGIDGLPAVRATTRFHEALATGGGSWTARSGARFAPVEARPGADAGALPTPDAAALVGVYQVGDVLLVLDAAGGYLLRTAEGSTRGTYRPAPGGLVLAPEGSEPVAMRLYGEALVDDVGLELAPARPE